MNRFIKILHKVKSQDGSLKYVFQNQKGGKFESIYFRLPKEKGIINIDYHICISSQIGCAMGCAFCATGYGGFFDQLTSEEMIEEVAIIVRDLILEGKEISTAVFSVGLMGMGEPFMNYENVVNFCYKAKNKFPNLGNIGISTVGIAQRIVDIAEVAKNISTFMLYISVHSPYNDLRSHIMPMTQKYPLEIVLKSCREFVKKTGSKVTASYLLFREVNDTVQHAKDFAKLLDRDFFEVQILLYNNTPGIPFFRSSDETALCFAEIIKSFGIKTIVQVSSGRDIDGGCGQLLKNINQKKLLS